MQTFKDKINKINNFICEKQKQNIQGYHKITIRFIIQVDLKNVKIVKINI